MGTGGVSGKGGVDGQAEMAVVIIAVLLEMVVVVML